MRDELGFGRGPMVWLFRFVSPSGETWRAVSVQTLRIGGRRERWALAPAVEGEVTQVVRVTIGQGLTSRYCDEFRPVESFTRADGAKFLRPKKEAKP